MRGLLNYQIATFESDNEFSFPPIFPVKNKINCSNWLDFDVFMGKRDKSKYKSSCVHFYIDDYKFERLWNNPKGYISAISNVEYVIQPDFSLYYDFPVALQIYNKYRNHWLSAYFNVNGISVIPNISLSLPIHYHWTLQGYPKKSVVAFSDLGNTRDNSERKLLFQQYDEMIRVLEPLQVIYFTRSKKYAPSEATIINLPYIRG